MNKKLLVSALISVIAFNVSAAEQLILGPNTFKPELILPTPPLDNSDEAIAERALIKSAIANASSSEIELAKKDANNKNVTYLSDVIPHFNLENLPNTKALFDVVLSNEKSQTEVFKEYFNRKRPYQVDNSITTCASSHENDLNQSDPSGHTTMAFSSAVVLAYLLPDYAKDILHRADQYAQHRIICGAHHPFDVRSGQVLGTLVGQKLLDSKKLSNLLLSAKKELDLHIPKKATLSGNVWTAIFVNAKAVDGRQPTLQIANNKVSGFAGCNQYSGDLINGNSYDQISFTRPMTTRMTCSAIELENNYLNALTRATNYKIVDKMLILKNDNGDNLLEFLDKRD